MSKILSVLTPIIAIIIIAGLEAYAISQHLNGVLLAGSIAIIAGLAGWSAPHKK